MRIRTVDAFTDRPFAGNPAAVCFLPDGAWPEDEWLLSVALELNLSETAFARPAGDREHADWDLRWFTPATEVRLCGHATLATAHLLRADGLADGRVRFATLSGVLTAEAATDGRIVLDFPANPPIPVRAPDRLTAALGTEPLGSYETGALGDLLVEVTDEQAVRTLTPEMGAIAGLAVRGVIVTAAAADSGSDYDYVSRFFAPRTGIVEDPVTGSAHTALAPFWSRRLGRATLTGLQASPRTGLVGTEVVGDRVRLSGKAITVLDGTLTVEIPTAT